MKKEELEDKTQAYFKTNSVKSFETTTRDITTRIVAIFITVLISINALFASTVKTYAINIDVTDINCLTGEELIAEAEEMYELAVAAYEEEEESLSEAEATLTEAETELIEKVSSAKENAEAQITLYENENNSLYALINWMLDGYEEYTGKVLTEDQITELTLAQSNLNSIMNNDSNWFNSNYSYTSDDINPQSSTDALALTNVLKSLAIIDSINELRATDDNYVGYEDCLTNFVMMAGSAYTADVSIYQVAHVSKYSKFSYNENLAWGYSNPTSGWYTSEKELFDACRDELGIDVSDGEGLTSSEISSIKTLANSYGYTIGHYTNLMYSSSQLVGVGYTTTKYKYGSTSSSNAAPLSKYTASYTTDEMREFIAVYQEYLEIYKDTRISELEVVVEGYNLLSVAESTEEILSIAESITEYADGLDELLSKVEEAEDEVNSITTKLEELLEECEEALEYLNNIIEAYNTYMETVGHNYEVTEKIDATCLEEGTLTYTCSICGDTYTETIEAMGHNYEVTEEIESTCSEEGTITYTCSNCGDTYTETIEATGHSYSNNVCSICGAVKENRISKATITLSTTSYTYSGSAKKPSVTVKINGTTLKKGTDYTVSYKNNTSIGKASVIIKGIGNYEGTITKTFKINPKKVTISSVKSNSAKKITITWKKSSESITKYQIRYRIKGTSTWKTTTVSSSKSSTTLENLTAGKTYEVQIRSYKTVSGTNYYSAWSDSKSVTVKKAQTLTIKKSTKTVKYSKAKKAKQTVSAITKVSGAKGTITYSKSSGSKYLSVNSKTGKITVKKGTPKGTYTIKVKVKAAATSTYAAATKTVTLTIKVK